MRLRNKTQAPERYEDGQYSTQAPHDPTKPAFPDLLAAATICFNPSLPAAAFPSSTTFQAGDEVGNATFDTTNLDLPLVHNSLSTIGVTSEAHCQQPGFAAVANGDWGTFDAPVWDGIRTFMDEAASSDEEGENAIRYRIGPDDDHITWAQIAPSLQVEILDNICTIPDDRDTFSVDDQVLNLNHEHDQFDFQKHPAVRVVHQVLGLSHGDVEAVLQHRERRTLQILAEDEEIKDLQASQESAILRTDHSSGLHSDCWREHVAITRRHMPYVRSKRDYLICGADQVTLAEKYLHNHGLGSWLLGEWTFNGTSYQLGPFPTFANTVDSGYTSQEPDQGYQNAETGNSEPVRKQLEIVTSSVDPPTSKPADPPVHFRSFRSGEDMKTAPRISDLMVHSGGQYPGLPMSIRAGNSSKITRYHEAMSAIKLGDEYFDDTEVSIDDEPDFSEPAQTSPRLRTNLPRLPQEGGQIPDKSADVKYGRQAIMLRVFPDGLARLEKLEKSKSKNKDLDASRIPSIPSTQAKIAPPHHWSDSVPMPVSRHPLDLQDNREHTPFVLHLLDIQRGAKGLGTPLTSSVVKNGPRDVEIVASPKRAKFNNHEGITNTSEEKDIEVETPDEDSQIQRKDSAAYQMSPAWSPISRRDSNMSIPPSHKSSLGDNTSQDSNVSAGPAGGLSSEVPTRPRTPHQVVTKSSKSSAAESGFPVLASARIATGPPRAASRTAFTHPVPNAASMSSRTGPEEPKTKESPLSKSQYSIVIPTPAYLRVVKPLVKKGQSDEDESSTGGQITQAKKASRNKRGPYKKTREKVAAAAAAANETLAGAVEITSPTPTVSTSPQKGAVKSNPTAVKEQGTARKPKSKHFHGNQFKNADGTPKAVSKKEQQ